MKQSTFFFLIISLFFGTCAKAQSIEELIRFANQQFDQGKYEIASCEYNRAYFLGYEKRDELLFKIANCYYHQHDYDLAGKFYDRAYLNSTHDSLKNEAVIAKSLSLLLSEKYLLAIAELFNFTEETTKDQQIKAHVIRGISHYQLNEDSISHSEFYQLLNLANAPDSAYLLLDNEFSHIHKYKKKYNPKRAYIMSAIIPGSGQFSSGAYRDGTNSFLLIGGLYLVSLRVMGLYSFWEAAILLLPWVQRYYIGGMEGAKEHALSKIEAKRYQSYLTILNITDPFYEP